MLSPAGEKNVDVQLLATYGTLRDDNDSEAPWAVDFIKVCDPSSFHLNPRIFFDLRRTFTMQSLAEPSATNYSVIQH